MLWSEGNHFTLEKWFISKLRMLSNQGLKNNKNQFLILIHDFNWNVAQIWPISLVYFFFLIICTHSARMQLQATRSKWISVGWINMATKYATHSVSYSCRAVHASVSLLQIIIADYFVHSFSSKDIRLTKISYYCTVKYCISQSAGQLAGCSHPIPVLHVIQFNIKVNP